MIAMESLITAEHRQFLQVLPSAGHPCESMLLVLLLVQGYDSYNLPLSSTPRPHRP